MSWGFSGFFYEKKVQKNCIICNMINVFIITCVLNKSFIFYKYWLQAFEWYSVYCYTWSKTGVMMLKM